jgi:CBS domain containing-hemolysin-like protein
MEPGYWIPITLVIGTWLTAVWAVLADLSRASIRKLDQAKHKDLVDRAEFWHGHRADYRITIRILSFINLGLFVLCSDSLLNSIPLALTAVAVFFVVSEMIGHWLAGYHWTILKVSMPVLAIVRPVAAMLTLFEDRLASARDLDEEEGKATTEDEIMSLVEQDETEIDAKSDLEDIERRMIRGIFDLDETLVKEVMTPRVDIDALAVSETIDDAKAKIVDCGHSRIPVYSETVDNIVGIIYSKHLLNDSKLQTAEGLEHIMQQPIFVPETKNVAQLLDEFRQRKNHMAVIIDEYGGTSGIVTIEDILEEIVGEIQDEFDDDEPPAHQTLADGAVEVDARMPIDEVNDLLDVAISEDEEYDTIGGYVTKILGRIPKVAEDVEMPGLTVHILDADDRKISRLLLVRTIAEEPAIARG